MSSTTTTRATGTTAQRAVRSPPLRGHVPRSPPVTSPSTTTLSATTATTTISTTTRATTRATTSCSWATPFNYQTTSTSTSTVKAEATGSAIPCGKALIVAD